MSSKALRFCSCNVQTICVQLIIMNLYNDLTLWLAKPRYQSYLNIQHRPCACTISQNFNWIFRHHFNLYCTAFKEYNVYGCHRCNNTLTFSPSSVTFFKFDVLYVPFQVQCGTASKLYSSGWIVTSELPAGTSWNHRAFQPSPRFSLSRCSCLCISSS